MKSLLISILIFGGLLCNNAYADQIQKMLAGDAQVSDIFGYTVSASGDYAIVGAYGEDAGGGNAGAAYVYYKDQGGADN